MQQGTVDGAPLDCDKTDRPWIAALLACAALGSGCYWGFGGGNARMAAVDAETG